MAARMQRPGLWGACAVGAAAALAAALLWHGPAAPPAALAQVPDSGAQRNEMIRELQIANRRLGEIADLLREIRDAQAGADKGRRPAPADAADRPRGADRP